MGRAQMIERVLEGIAGMILLSGALVGMASAQTAEDTLRTEAVRARAFARAEVTQGSKVLEMIDRGAPVDSIIAEIVRGRGFGRASDTQWTKTLDVAGRVQVPPDTIIAPPDTVIVDPEPDTTSDPAWPDGPVTDLLPQTHPYQRGLAVWLASLAVDDLTIPIGAPAWDRTYPSNTWLAETYLELATSGRSNPHMPAAAGLSWETGVMQGLPEHFTLDGMTDVPGWTLPTPEPEYRARNARQIYPAAYWYEKDLPGGNPWYQNRALANRILVSVAVQMMMVDYWHTRPLGPTVNPWDISAFMNADQRWVGGYMNVWAYAYFAAREVLPAETRRAFEAGMKRMTAKLLSRSVGRNNPNMSTRTIPAMVMVYRHAEDPELRDMAIRTAKKHLTGYEDGVLWSRWHANSLAYPAGYVQEGYSPETTYNGVSLYHVAEAYARAKGDPAWEFLREFIRRMSSFRAHQILPLKPNFNSWQGVTAPSAYAGRTGAGWDRLQASHEWRDASIAAWMEEGVPFHALSDPGGLLTAPRMAQTLYERVFRAGSDWHTYHWSKISTKAVPEFRLDADLHWPGYAAYWPGGAWYDRLFPVAAAGGDRTLPPFWRRGHSFSKSFADDFWAYKDADAEGEFGWFVESEADGGTYGGYRGGSLQAFWTEHAGVVILGRKNKDSRQWEKPGDSVDLWAAHHVWGKTPAGYWSSSVERYREVAYGDSSVTVSGPLNGEDQQAPVEALITTTFTALPDGLRIEHALRGDLPEAWVSLPVLEEVAVSCDGALLETTARIVQSCTLTKGGASVYLALSAPREVRLASQVWQQVYMGDERIRTVHIDARGGTSFTLRTGQ